MKFLSYCALLVVFTISEARYVPGEVPDFYAMVEPHMKVQIPQYIAKVSKYFKYAVEDFEEIGKNFTDAETELSQGLKSITSSLAKETLEVIQATGTKVSDEKLLTKQVEDGITKSANEFLKEYGSGSEGVKILKNDLLAKESLVDELVKTEIPKLIDDFVKIMKPEESKTKSQQYVKDLKGPGREKVVADFRRIFESDAAKIIDVQKEVMKAELEASYQLVKGIDAVLSQVVKDYVKDGKQKEEVQLQLSAKAYKALEPEVKKALESATLVLNSAEKVINNTADYVVDEIDYQLKRLTNAVSVILMSTFD